MHFCQWIKLWNQVSGVYLHLPYACFFSSTISLLSYAYALFIHLSRYWMPTGVSRNSVTLPCHSSWRPTTTHCRSTPAFYPASRTRTTLSTRLALNNSYLCGRLSEWRYAEVGHVRVLIDACLKMINFFSGNVFNPSSTDQFTTQIRS